MRNLSAGYEESEKRYMENRMLSNIEKVICQFRSHTLMSSSPSIYHSFTGLMNETVGNLAQLMNSKTPSFRARSASDGMAGSEGKTVSQSHTVEKRLFQAELSSLLARTFYKEATS